MDIDAIRLSPIQCVEHMCNNKCFICHKVGCHTNKHPHPGNKATNHPSPSSSTFTHAAVISKANLEPNLLLNYTQKCNITEKEAVYFLGIVYGELNQDETLAESGSSEEVVAQVDF